MSRVVPCPRCRALNGEDFGRCVRCGVSLDGSAAAPERRVVQVALAAPPRLLGTKAFGALTALVFAGQLALSLATGHGVPLLSTKDPTIELRFGAMLSDPGLVTGEPFRLLSAVFVHFGLLHFGMNAYVYVDLARVAETFLGPGRFAVTFTLAGAVGFLATVLGGLVFGGPPTLTAGASGAVFGLMGVVLGALLARRDPRWRSFAMRAVLYSVLFGFAINASGTGVLVNNAAHLGGLAVGIVAGLLAPRPFPPLGKAALGANLLGAAAFALCVGSVLLALRSPLPALLGR